MPSSSDYSPYFNNSEALFFDFDDVIVQSLDIKAQAFLKLFPNASEQEINAIRHVFYHQTGRSRHHKLRHVYSEILHQTISEADINRLAEQFGMFCLRDVIACDEVEGASAFLHRIPRHVKRFVVSGTVQVDLDIIVERRNLSAFFDAVRGTPIPKEDHIANLLEDYRLNAAQCVMFGDGIVDYEAASQNGLQFIGLVKDPNNNPFPPHVESIANFKPLVEVFDDVL